MEQAKEIIESNSANIQKQCAVLTRFLNKLAEMDKTNVVNATNVANKDLIEHSKYMLSVSNFQCLIISKLCQSIIDFEILSVSSPAFHSPRSSQLDNSMETKSDMNIEVIKQYVQNISQRTVSPTENTVIETPAPIEKQDSPVAKEKPASPVVVKEKPVATIMQKIRAICNIDDFEPPKTSATTISPEVKFKSSGRCTGSLSNSDKALKKKASNFERFSYDELGSTDCYFGLREKAVPSTNDSCLISHMESPSEFYIQLLDEESAQLDAISDTIRNLYENKPYTFESKQRTKEEFGKYCTAYVHSYETWYRAEVIDWMMDDNTDDVYIQLVDHGHKYQIQYQSLRPLTQKLCNLPKLALLCHLAYLVPPRNLKDWPIDSIEGFLDILGRDFETKYDVTFASQEEESIGIDLVKSGDETSIASILLDSNLAYVSKECREAFQSNRLMIEQIANANGIDGIPNMTTEEKLERFLSDMQLTERTDNINEAVGYYDPKDEARICRFTKDGKCFKQNCHLEHTEITKDFTTDKIPVYKKALNELVMPKAGDDITLKITFVCSINRFYAHIIQPYSEGGMSMVGLSDLLNSRDVAKNYKPLRMLPALSEIVIAKNWDDRWCRGQVLDIGTHKNDSDVEVQIWAVDYGETVDVKFTDLREISEEFLYLPFQAVECRLFNVTKNEEVSQEDAVNAFEMSYICKDYQAKVIANVGYLEVLVKDELGNDIGESLIKEGVAKQRLDHFIPRDGMLLID